MIRQEPKIHYKFQDIDNIEPILEKMLYDKIRLTTLYTYFRKEARWDAIGDFPLISAIVRLSAKHGYIFSNKQIIWVLHRAQDGEFKNASVGGEFFAHLRAFVNSQNPVERLENPTRLVPYIEDPK